MLYYMMMFPLVRLGYGEIIRLAAKIFAFSGRKRYNRTGVSRIRIMAAAYAGEEECGLHRAGCQITSGGGDSKAHVQHEIYRRLLAGKGGKAV